MKRIILQFLLVAGLCLPASAQNEERSMVLAISPIAAIGGGVDVLYQAKMTDFLAITVPVSFYYRWGYSKTVQWLSDRTEDFSQTKAPISYSAGLGAKFLLAGRGIADSFYLEPRIIGGYNQFGAKYSSKNVEQKIEYSHYHVSPMLRFGWDWVYDSGVFLTLGLGAGPKFYIKNQSEIPTEIADKHIKYLLPSEKT